ncbi:MAG: YncE family protein, partial [Planctomycetota bacterium]
PDLPPPPPVSLIVRKDAATGQWLDDVGGDWSAFITWDQHDHDVAVIDAETLAVSYVTGLMNANMSLTAHPDGRVIVVGTEALNDVRYEPNLTGRFVRSVAAIVPVAQGEAPNTRDLNPHLADAYASGASRVSEDLRARSLADPRGVAFSPDGARGFVSGMGSNNVAVIDGDAHVVGRVDVGQGPTGLALDAARGRLYVMNRFDASISTIDTETLVELSRTPFFDPTPPEIRAGRPFLYDAHLTSGLGVTACAACHIDGRTDQLAWDLGDPSGQMKPFNQSCNHPFLDLPVGVCEDWHPMKGPMTTQTLQHIIGTEPFHWRGDRENLAAFNGAFVSLLGREEELSDDEMRAFEAFLDTVRFPPNPNTHLDGSLKQWLSDGSTPIEGSPANGRRLFFTKGIDLGLVRCNDCHDVPEMGAGTNHKITPRELLINPHQSIKVPQIRDMFEKTGFSRESRSNNFGFGHNHDGTVDGLVNFFHIPNFTGFSEGEQGEQERRDIIAFVFSMSTDTHAAVGAQVTLSAPADTAQADRLALFQTLADQGVVGLVAHGRFDGERRGFAYLGDGVFQSDRAGETVTWDGLLASAEAGGPLTWTVTPAGSQTRLGVDRDRNGVLDGNESANAP